jgi:hypothetical protein
MEIRRRVITRARTHELHRFEREARIGVTPRRVDRQPDAFCQTRQPRADRRPFGIRKRLVSALRRHLGMQFERQPAGADAQFFRRFLDPDRAEITKRSNDVRPDEQDTIVDRL